MIDLSPADRDQIIHILKDHLQHYSVYIFGSRVSGHSEPLSDVDLLISGDLSAPADQIEALKDAFSAFDLPVSVDIVDINAVSDEFRKTLGRAKKELFVEIP